MIKSVSKYFNYLFTIILMNSSYRGSEDLHGVWLTIPLSRNV